MKNIFIKFVKCQKIKEFLKNDSLKQVIISNGFPVKVQIPVGLLIKATVTFNKFRYLENTEEFVKETFAIPDYCKYLCRKEGMKTLQNKKKRLIKNNSNYQDKYNNLKMIKYC